MNIGGLHCHSDRRVRRPLAACLAALAAFAPTLACADESGVSFWLPGSFASFAAAPLEPGWALSTTYYHASVAAGADVTRSRDVQLRRLPVTLSSTATLSASLNTEANLFFVAPSYTFASPVLGGQASLGLTALLGTVDSTLGAALNGTVTSSGPFGTSLSFGGSRSITQSAFSVGDLYPQAALRWNFGLNNLMAYVTGDIPVGYYDSQSLVSTGIGHAAIDAGGAYTYLNEKTGQELSATLGFTYNFQNPTTQYQNGTDMHLDLAAAQFLNEQLFIGAVGYVYKEIGCDTGGAPVLGCFQSQVAAAGPQLGIVFPLAGKQALVNLKAYQEFAAQNRASGFNVWVGFTLSNAPSAK